MNIDNITQSKVYFNTYTAMRRLIENSYFKQREIAENGQRLYYESSPMAFFKEFCTVKVCTARQSGHTVAMLRIGKDLFDKSLYLFHNESMRYRIKNMAEKDYPQEMLLGRYEFDSINSMDRIIGNNFENRLEAVFVDTATFVSNNKKEMIYEHLGNTLARKPYYFFIFVE